MAQADSGLSAFLGGKSFGTDVLGSLRPQMQLVVAAQDFGAAGVKEPTIKLPAYRPFDIHGLKLRARWSSS